MKKAEILIVDDRDENLLTLEALLDDPQITTIRASSGMEALTKTLDHDFALVLLDVNMPEMDGYEVAELMRGKAKTKNIPIIFVTAALKNMEHIFRGYESGAVDYLFKPLEPTIFKGKVGVFIELYRQRETLTQKTIELDKRLAELEELQQQLEETNEQLQLLSSLDSLTGLLNRRRFDEVYAEEWQRCLRNKKPLSLLLIDIDHFKLYNDTYGHVMGDEALRRVASIMTDAVLRKVDKIARYGGEEFVVILPDTDEDGCVKVAETIRSDIEKLGIEHSASVINSSLTVSIGGATAIPENGLAPIRLVQKADEALYDAKKAGKNRCEFEHCKSLSLLA